MRYAKIKKENLLKWAESLREHGKLYGPRKKENQFVFRPVDDVKDIELNYIPTILPPKKYYFPQQENLLHFEISPFKTGKAIKEFEEFVLFGVHTCDIAGIQCMDIVFKEDPADANYVNRKEKMTTVGIECMRPCDEYASCKSMGNHVPKGGYDIMLTEVGDMYIMHVNSEKGVKILKNRSYIKECDNEDIEKLDEARQKKESNFKEELSARLDKIYDSFDKKYESKVWEDVGKRCVGCGNCTAVCPTCYCFDIQDAVDLDLNSGTRFRIWNYCQMDDFAKVATGEDFRKDRLSRQRHRYYRKFKYPLDKYNRFFCTGCGRCTRTCMAKISLIETVNDLVKE